jgi:transcriptional regulator with XRE-family HTH domain
MVAPAGVVVVAQGLTLEEVAAKGKFSSAHLSQIERGAAVPSVSTLLSIATALNVHADYFLRLDQPNEEQAGPVKSDAPVQFTALNYDVGASGGEFAHEEEGQEFGVVMEGTLLVELGSSKHVLQSGSSIAYDRRTPHRLSNIGDVPVKGIWAILED